MPAKALSLGFSGATMMLPLTVQAVILCEPLLSSITPDAVTACAKEVNRKMATPLHCTAILQWIYLLEVNWQDAPDTSRGNLQPTVRGAAAPPSLFQVPPFSPCLLLLFFHPGLRLPSTGISQHASGKKHCFLIVLCSLLIGSLPPFSVCVSGGGVAMLLIVAGVFLTSCSDILCSDILASCSELLGPSLLGLGFPNLWYQHRFSKVGGKPSSISLGQACIKKSEFLEVMLCLALPTVAWTSPVTKTLSTVVWNSQGLELNTWLWRQSGELRSVWAACNPALENRKLKMTLGCKYYGCIKIFLWIRQRLGFIPIWRAREGPTVCAEGLLFSWHHVSSGSSPLCFVSMVLTVNVFPQSNNMKKEPREIISFPSLEICRCLF